MAEATKASRSSKSGERYLRPQGGGEQGIVPTGQRRFSKLESLVAPPIRFSPTRRYVVQPNNTTVNAIAILCDRLRLKPSFGIDFKQLAAGLADEMSECGKWKRTSAGLE